MITLNYQLYVLAAISPIEIDDFSGNETLVDYTELVFEFPLSEPIHGQTFSDVLHHRIFGQNHYMP